MQGEFLMLAIIEAILGNLDIKEWAVITIDPDCARNFPSTVWPLVQSAIP
jgi:hypothetical protein